MALIRHPITSIKKIYRLPRDKKRLLVRHLLILLLLACIGLSPMIALLFANATGLSQGFGDYQKATSKSAKVINDIKKTQAARATLIKQINQSTNSSDYLNKAQLSKPVGIEQALNSFIYASCVSEQNSFCAEHSSALSKSHIHQTRKTSSSEIAFKGLIFNGKSKETLDRLVKLNNLTYRQQKLSRHLYDIRHTGAYTSRSFDYDNDKIREYPKAYEWSLTRAPVGYDNYELQLEAYVVLQLILFLSSIIASVLITIMALLIRSFRDNFINSLTIIEDIINNKYLPVEKARDIDAGIVVFENGRQFVESSDQWDKWQGKLSALDKAKKEQIEFSNNELATAWSGLSNLNIEQNKLHRRIKRNKKHMNNLAFNLSLIFTAIKQLPVSSISITDNQLEIKLNANLNKFNQVNIVKEKEDGIRLFFSLASLKLNNGWIFSIAQDNLEIVSNNKKSTISAFAPIALQKKLLLLQQAAANCQANFFTILNSIITSLDNNEKYVDNSTAISQELNKRLILTKEDLLNKQLRNKQIQSQLKEKIAACVKTAQMPELAKLGQDRISRWFKQLTEASSLNSIEKIETYFSSYNQLSLTIHIKAQNIKAVNGDIYRLKPMRLVGLFEIKANSLVQKDLRCKKVCNNKLILHPHVLSKINASACLGDAKEPLNGALSQDDVFAAVHILANWSSTVSKSKMHQERLIKWCEKMPTDAPLGVIKDEMIVV